MANSQTITPANLGYIHGVSSAIQTQLDNRAILSASNTFTNATNTFNEIEVTNINASGVVDVTQLLVNCVNMSTNTTYTSANLPNIIMCFNASPTLPDPTTVGAGFIVTIKNFYSTHGCTVACTASNALYINGTANNTFNVGNGGFIGLVTAYGVWNNIN